jgi:pyruvate dehydrogenase E1 component
VEVGHPDPEPDHLGAAFAIEVDWILSDAIRRHMMDDNEGRRGVLIRAVTRAIPQKALLDNLRKQARYKAGLPEGTLLAPAGSGGRGGSRGRVDPARPARRGAPRALRADVLSRRLLPRRLARVRRLRARRQRRARVRMGSLAIEASRPASCCFERGVCANVIAVSSPELLLGILGRRTSTATCGGSRHHGDLYLAESDVQARPA